MNAVLISTYELGHQPFGLASPAAWLENAGVSVTCLDLAVQALNEADIRAADLVAFYVPMHTATRIAVALVERVRRLNPAAHLCFYGLYAPVNADYLRALGAATILGGEFEAGLVALARRIMGQGPAPGVTQPEPLISLARQAFQVPERRKLPPLSRYAYLDMGDGRRRTVGYTEASRGCKHLCRHCPIVPIYNGRFRIVQRDVVLADIQRQVDGGAQHITFGDPDFFNGPGHAIPLVKELHRRWPALTYDVTIKIEHLLRYAEHVPLLGDTGCLFVTSAVEAVDDRILAIFDKGHTRSDFIRVVRLFQQVGLTLNPTFVAFTPWITAEGYLDLLTLIADLDLVPNVAPIQYAIRLLIPAGSRLLALPSVRDLVGEFDPAALCYPWSHADPGVDRLQERILDLVAGRDGRRPDRVELFGQIWRLAQAACEAEVEVGRGPAQLVDARLRAPIPFLSEPWYC